MIATTGSNIATIAARGAGTCRSAATKRPNVTIVPMTTTQSISAHTGASADEIAEQAHLLVDDVEREAPPRLDDGEEERPEDEAVAGQRDRVAVADTAFGQEDVEGERARCRECRGDTHRIERAGVPDLDDQ